MDHFTAIRRKFEDAGVTIHSYTMNFIGDFTDDEIDRTFDQAKALGTNIIASSTQVNMARRLLAFAEKHKTLLAFHGHSNTRDPNEFATPESFQTALSLSKYARINLDIGHFSAAGYDPVAFIQEHHERITHLHVKDRKNNDGPNVPWGQGDTPIKAVLLLLKEKKYPIPAFVEYEYPGTGTPVEEVKKCLDYMRRILS
jgi:sugar phosphate isomerase/epimerase